MKSTTTSTSASTTATNSTSASSTSRSKPHATGSESDLESFHDASSDISIVANKRDANLLKAKHTEICLFKKNPTLEPIFLRKCRVQKATHSKTSPTVFVIQKLETLKAYKKNSSQMVLLKSLDYSTFCVRYLTSNTIHFSRHILIYQSTAKPIKFLARPDFQQTTQSKFDDASQIAQLMLAPDRALVARKMVPNWNTVTFTLAYGRHVAVKYRIAEVGKQHVRAIKAKREKTERVSSRTLYRKEPMQRVETWKCARAHQLRLSTVEENDPQMVKRVIIDAQSNHIRRKTTEKTTSQSTELSVIWQRNVKS